MLQFMEMRVFNAISSLDILGILLYDVIGIGCKEERLRITGLS